MLQNKGFNDDVLECAGLIARTKNNRWRDFFSDRIIFPIIDVSQGVIAFSARKYKEETFGGKYINTLETPLFKKHNTLFGLNYCRRRIAKERGAIVVEGQIDALQLIHHGLNLTVAALGTAFGEGHVQQLVNLGVNCVYLVFDGDLAGQEAACKTGGLFQKKGIEVYIVPMSKGEDPDTVITDKGINGLLSLFDEKCDYLTFLVDQYSKNINSPAGKNELVHTIARIIRGWENKVMIHESLRKLAQLVHVPDEVVGIGQEYVPQILIRKTSNVGSLSIDPDRIIESDLLRWLLIFRNESSKFINIVQQNLKESDFHVKICRSLYLSYLSLHQQKKDIDLLSLTVGCEEEMQDFISEVLQKKINKNRVDKHFIESIQRILDRNWMEHCEEIKTQIQSGKCSEEEVLELSKQFTELKKNPPTAVNNLAC